LAKKNKQKIIVVGASAPGVRLASLMARDPRYTVTLIHGAKNFDFSTALYTNSSGYSRRRIMMPLKKIFNTVRFKRVQLIDEMVMSFDPTNKVLSTKEGNVHAYDQLVLALESDSRINSQKKHVYNGYSARSMSSLREYIHESVKNEEQINSISIIGGGKTGIELAAETRMLLNRLLGKSLSRKTIITIYEKSESPKKGVGAKQIKKLTNRLSSMKIEVHYATPVAAIGEDSLLLKNETEVKTDVVIIASGTVSNSFYADNKKNLLLSKEGYVRCSDLFEAEGYSDIYVIGSNRHGSTHNDLGEALYDSEYVASILSSKSTGAYLPKYTPPNHYHSLSVGKLWGVYISKRAHFGIAAALIIRWIELKHFATLLPKRYAPLLWLKGSKQDIQ
jgi:NADH dehydrogenase FAD-containing subunit